MKLDAKSRLTAAPVPNATQSKLMEEIFKRANLKSFGMYLKAGEIRSDGLISKKNADDVIAAIKKLGFSKPWKGFGSYKGLVRKDGTWPIGYYLDLDEGEFYLSIEPYNYDTIDPDDKRRSKASFKAVVKEVASVLGVKAYNFDTIELGSRASVEANNVRPADASKLMRAYGKPKIVGNQLLFKKDYGILVLTFSRETSSLRSISCGIS